MKVFLMPDICQRYNDSAKFETLNQLSRTFFKDFFEFLVLWLYFPNLRRRKYVLEGVFRLVFVNLKTQISIDKSLNDNKLKFQTWQLRQWKRVIITKKHN